MTTQLDSRRLMNAPASTESTPTTGTDGEEVTAMAIFEARRGREERASAEGAGDLSAIDRAVMLESLRVRRKLREQHQAIHHELFGLRANR